MANLTPQQISEVLENFFQTNRTQQYVGARYVPLFGRKGEDTVEWNGTKPYESLTIVMYQGNSYCSRDYVPANVPITDTHYWANMANFNAQIELYRREVAEALEGIQTNTDAIAELVSGKVPYPTSGSKYGTALQVLTTNGDGSTQWANPAPPTDAQAEEYITAWLDAHPEATTTIEDGAVTNAKLATDSLRKNKMRTGEFLTWGGNLVATLPTKFTSVDQFEGNTVYSFNKDITEDLIADAPAYGTPARCVTLGFVMDGTHGISTGMQIWICSTGADIQTKPRVFYRLGTGYKDAETGKYTYGPWLEFASKDDTNAILPIDNAKLATDSLRKNRMRSGEFMTWGGNLHPTLTKGFTSVDQFGGNTIYAFSAAITEDIIADAPVYGLYSRCVTFGFIMDETHGISTGIQLWVSSSVSGGISKPRVFYRFGTGYKEDVTGKYQYGPWLEFASKEDTDAITDELAKDIDLISVFESFAVIGDSLSAGFVASGTGQSYGSNMAREAGRNWPTYLGLSIDRPFTNLARGSSTARDWRYGNTQLDVDISTADIDTYCYMVALGVNDARQSLVIGGTGDINTDKDNNSNTFYGNYDWVIRKLIEYKNSRLSQAKIFVFTMAPTETAAEAYNAAIRYVASLYDDVNCIDMYTLYYKEFTTAPFTTLWIDGHSRPIGYAMVAKWIQRAVNQYMYEHPSMFSYDPWLPLT